MQKIGMLADWEMLGPESYIVVPAGRNKRSRIEANAPDPCGLYWYPLDKNGKPDKSGGENFLALVEGYEIVEFIGSFDVAVVPDTRCWINSRDDRVIEPHKATDSFTRIVERRAADPALAYVKRQALLNQRRLEAQLFELRSEIGAKSQPSPEPVNEPKPAQSPLDQSNGAGRDDAPPGEPKPGEGSSSPVAATGTGGQSNGG